MPERSSRSAWPRGTSRERRFKAPELAERRYPKSPRPSQIETSKVFAQAFFKRLAERETASRGLSRLRQTQEGVRERARWALSQGEPSSGVPPWKCAKAHFQKGCHQSLLKPAPSARRPLAEAAAVFQSWVPPRPLPGLSPAARAPRSLLFFHRLRRFRPWSSAPHLANF